MPGKPTHPKSGLAEQLGDWDGLPRGRSDDWHRYQGGMEDRRTRRDRQGLPRTLRTLVHLISDLGSSMAASASVCSLGLSVIADKRQDFSAGHFLPVCMRLGVCVG